MKSLYIMGTAGSGKTSIALGLALKFKQEGFSVAYFKPVGCTAESISGTDEDALLMQKILQMEHPLDTIVPFLAGPSYLSWHRHSIEHLKSIREAYKKITSGIEILIIGGTGSPHMMGCLGLDAVSLAREFESAAIFTVHIENDFSLDQAIFFNHYLECRNVPIAGNIFPNVPRPLLAKTEGIYRPIMTGHGYRTLGIIPAHPEVTSPTVKEYLEVLGGEILAGEESLERVVEDVVIGAMTIESALIYFRRSPNKAVITGGDRSEIAMAALETSTSVLILTGGLYPDIKVISRADEKNIPVILVHNDTYSTIEKLSTVTRRIRATDERAIKLSLENIEKYCDWRSILQILQ